MLSTHISRRALVLAVMGCCAASGAVTTLGPVASASASDASIKQVLGTDLPKITAEEAKFITALAEYEKTGSVAPIDSALESNVAILQTTRTEIARQSAQGKRVKTAKKKLERSLRRVIGAYKRLKVAFDVKKANPNAAKRQARKALAAIKKADGELREAAKLLQ